MILNITGALTAARNVVCPAVNKMYIIKNSTTGGFPITIKTNLGSGVSIPNGQTDIVYCNGTDVVTAMTVVRFSSTTGSAILPASTTANRDTSPLPGYLRFNTTLNQFEGYNNSAWGAVGTGATGGVGNYAFYENDQTVTVDYTLTTGKNAGTFGPITINNGITVTVPNGATWSIV
jgi:hypothetical protein